MGIGVVSSGVLCLGNPFCCELNTHTHHRDATTLTRKRKMILTNCAACAAPLAHNAPRCVRCHTRYCNATCQHDHWRRGHKQMCKKIHRGGNAEQYNADKKYKEAVAVAVEACAADTKREKYSEIIFSSENASQDDQREAVAVLADTTKTRRRIFGANHPYTVDALRMQERAKMRLEDVDAPPA